MTKLAYSINQVCETTGLGRTKIYEAIKDGRLRARKFGKRTMVLHEDLEAFLSNLRVYEGSHVKN